MRMHQCPNCGGLVGFKRSFGLGTVVLILLTFGFWILVLPLYPQRCIRCGLCRNATLQSSRRQAFLTICVVVVALTAVVASIIHGSSITQPGQQPSNDAKSNNPAVPNTLQTSALAEQPSADAVPSNTDATKPEEQATPRTVEVDGIDMLRAYEKDAADAQEIYGRANVIVTGTLTQILYPSQEETEKLLRDGIAPNPIITIDSAGIRWSHPEEGLFTPGIQAHSKDGTFFGLSDPDQRALRSGEKITLSCGKADYLKISEMTGRWPRVFGDYVISLYDCSFPAQP